MAAFRKGHSKVVKWLVKHVTQFPSDTELTRFIATISDLKKTHQCLEIIRVAKERQASEAIKAASMLLMMTTRTVMARRRRRTRGKLLTVKLSQLQVKVVANEL
jgi:ankyrin repeat domain-containing protein 17